MCHYRRARGYPLGCVDSHLHILEQLPDVIPQPLDLEEDRLELLSVLTLNVALPDGIEDPRLKLDDIVCLLHEIARWFLAFVPHKPLIKEGAEQAILVDLRDGISGNQASLDQATGHLL